MIISIPAEAYPTAEVLANMAMLMPFGSRGKLWGNMRSINHGINAVATSKNREMVTYSIKRHFFRLLIARPIRGIADT